jgi:2-iminobutanoate/2-iminopropanoate deaminase
MKIVASDKAPKAIGPYSQAVVVECGKILFLSGQIGIVQASGDLIQGGIEAEVRQVLYNMEAVLTAAGMTKENVTKTTIFLTDMGHFQTTNSIYGEFFGDHRPARSTLQVSALPRSALVEIEAIAVQR